MNSRGTSCSAILIAFGHTPAQANLNSKCTQTVAPPIVRFKNFECILDYLLLEHLTFRGYSAISNPDEILIQIQA